MSTASRTISRLDLNLLGTALIIAAVGCLLVYSATHFGPASPLFRKQILWVSIGIALMILMIAVDYRVLMEISPFLYAVGIAMLIYVLIWGRLTRHVKSWIHVGDTLTFQPAEFMKIFTALLIAKYFDSNDHAYLNAKNLIGVMAIIGLPVILIAVQPALGSAAAFFPLVGVAMFFGGIKPKYWLIMILAVLLALPVGWHYLRPFQQERIRIFLDPERDPLGSGYQVMQAKIATGSGGITGKGFLQGTQVNLEYLPARHTDFIFSVLGEEWGFVGVVILLSLYLFLILESLRVAKDARDRGGTFLVLGLIAFFIFHVLINVSMQIGLLPVTGIPLPLVSYGGSATMMFFMAIGLILNVDFRKFVNV
jgi:rod shape determining protein RodA